MYLFLAEAHSGWRYLVILVGAVALGRMAWGWLGNGTWGDRDRQLGLVAAVMVDIQVLLGIVIWLMGPWREVGGADVRGWEHPVTMLIALAVMHIGWSRARKQETAPAKFQQATLWFLATAVILALGIYRVTSAV